MPDKLNYPKRQYILAAQKATNVLEKNNDPKVIHVWWLLAKKGALLALAILCMACLVPRIGGGGGNFHQPMMDKAKDSLPITTEMVFIQGGTFQMGDIFGDGETDEKPVHSVTVAGFYMGKYEVTVKEFA